MKDGDAASSSGLEDGPDIGVELGKFESWRYAPLVSASTLLITAGDDEMIPHLRTEHLLASFRPGIAREVVVPGSSHNSIYENAAYKSLLAEQAVAG